MTKLLVVVFLVTFLICGVMYPFFLIDNWIYLIIGYFCFFVLNIFIFLVFISESYTYLKDKGSV